MGDFRVEAKLHILYCFYHFELRIFIYSKYYQLGLGTSCDNNYLKPVPYNLQQIIYMTASTKWNISTYLKMYIPVYKQTSKNGERIKQRHGLFISVLELRIKFYIKMGLDPISYFIPNTFVRMSQDRTFISIGVCHGFGAQWLIRVISIDGIVKLPLFQLSFHN